MIPISMTRRYAVEASLLEPELWVMAISIPATAMACLFNILKAQFSCSGLPWHVESKQIIVKVELIIT